jgi:putrescine aminotransferase
MPSQRQLFLAHLAQTTDFPMMVDIERAEGIYLYGPDGKKYIDLISGIGVSALGHRHPSVTNAVKEQVDRYMHVMVYGEFVQTPQVQLAKYLTEHLPDNLDNVFLVNSGSEAAEGALKLAKRYTGRPNILYAHNAYHGSTHGALAVGGGEHFKAPFRPLMPGVYPVRYGVMEDIELINNATAAIILETVQGEAGVVVAKKDYWKAIRNRCDETGTLLILDEIQSGIGRTGKLWAFEHFDIVPDILITAKGLGGGMPIGAFISSLEIMKVLRNDPILGHISTFGGHPVSSAAALATVKTVIEEGLVDKVADKAKFFSTKLKHPLIKGLRQMGFMMALQFDSFETTKAVVDRCTETGIITDWFLFCDNALRIAPPLIITESEVEEACDTLINAINWVYERQR